MYIISYILHTIYNTILHILHIITCRGIIIRFCISSFKYFNIYNIHSQNNNISTFREYVFNI